MKSKSENGERREQRIDTAIRLLERWRDSIPPPADEPLPNDKPTDEDRPPLGGHRVALAR